MGKYEELLMECEIEVKETSRLPKGFDGWYQNGKIFIRPTLPEKEKLQTLHEELAHHKLTYGNILDQSQFNNRKFENYARRLAYESVITLQGLIDAFEFGVHNLHEMSLFFEVTEGFVQECIKHYKNKYGLQVKYGDYLIRFEPLTIYKNIVG
ncbi:ImmA/IrrE family metallo-endopeptidase [Staphylococcus delphini]|uniref:ImmA/IrrE family metallo-endopeptidase n=1 Tax=Staphylococcus delphini TaxID=53344 RepID=UPI003364D902